MGRVQTVLGVYTRAMVVLSSLYAGWAIEYHNMSLAINFTFLHFIISLFGILVLKMAWKNGNNIFLKASYMPELPEVQTVVNQIKSGY